MLMLRAQLGVNGYSFAITNNGYVIFHPRFDPMVSLLRIRLVNQSSHLPYQHSVNANDILALNFFQTNFS